MTACSLFPLERRPNETNQGGLKMKYKRGGSVILKPFLEERLRPWSATQDMPYTSTRNSGEGGQINMLIKLQPDMLPLSR